MKKINFDFVGFEVKHKAKIIVGAKIDNTNVEQEKFYLSYAPLTMEEDVQEYVFEQFSELCEFVKTQIIAKEDHAKVYLYQYGGLENPIVISNNPNHLIHFFEQKNNAGFSQHNIHEYESYEDAYKVALDMMEPHELCYNENDSSEKPEYLREMRLRKEQLGLLQRDREYKLKLRKQLKKRIKEAYFDLFRNEYEFTELGEREMLLKDKLLDLALSRDKTL